MYLVRANDSKLEIVSEAQINFEEMLDCQICLQKKFCVEFMVFSAKCKHQFCYECVNLHADNKIKVKEPISCLKFGCKEELNEHHESTRMLKPFLKEKHLQLIKQRKQAHLRNCITPNCSGRIDTRKTYLDEYRSYIVCPNCEAIVCFPCNNPWQSCTCQSDQQARQQIMQSFKYSKCPKCGHMVEKTKGCEHIICVCKQQFCNICSQPWLGDGHICPKDWKTDAPLKSNKRPNINYQFKKIPEVPHKEQQCFVRCRANVELLCLLLLTSFLLPIELIAYPINLSLSSCISHCRLLQVNLSTYLTMK